MEDPDKAGGVTTMEDGALAPPQDSKPTESAFMAETTDAEALQPHMLAEAKRSPNKPLEEPNKKPATSEAHPIAQGPHQMGSLNINNPKPLSAPIPSLLDLAPMSTVECTITSDMPHHGAVNTSNWATLAMRPDTISPDVNSSMAIDWHATSGRVSLINNGTICWPSRWQVDASSTTPKNDNVAATHGSKEALCPHSPTPDTSGSLKTLTTSFSDIHPPLMFTCNHQYYPPDHTYRHAS
jgi:hypothetical protein